MSLCRLRARWGAWLLLLCGLLATPAHAERLALVVGINAYRNTEPISNAINDAQQMANALRQGGFTLIGGGVQRDLDAAGLQRVVGQLQQRLTPQDEVLFYFAGHGVQLADQTQLLLPTDAQVQPGWLAAHALKLSDVLTRLKPARLRVLVLDACRDNPFPVPAPAQRSVAGATGLRGLGLPLPGPLSRGTAVLLAASGDQKALDEVPGVSSRQGLSTWALLRAWQRPGVDVVEAMQAARPEVQRLARLRQHEQWPAYLDEKQGRLELLPAAAAPAPSSPGPGPGPGLPDCAACPPLVRLLPGRLVMGSPPGEAGRFETEGPPHEVTLPRPLDMGRTEVTRGQFRRFVEATGYRTTAEGAGGGPIGCHVPLGDSNRLDPVRQWRNPGFEQTDDHPVVCVSWRDAQAYLGWLNTIQPASPTKAWRLPSEAEWEYAARAGSRDAYSWGPLPGNGQANCDGCGSSWDNRGTAPVGRFQPNAFGLLDLHGNVWELVHDRWHPSYRGAPTDGSAWVTGGHGAARVVRGGGWYNGPQAMRSARRAQEPPDYAAIHIGFRVARSP